MQRTNMRATRTKPERAELLMLRVVRTERVSPSFVRVVFTGDDLAGFRPMGYDQWFRLFLPLDGGDLTRAPRKLDAVSFVTYLTAAKSARPMFRSYTVRAFRRLPDGDELDVDFVLHDAGGGHLASEPTAAAWAVGAQPGDLAGMIDEGIGFDRNVLGRPIVVVADESALPAAAGILASLPRTTRGTAILEIPTEADVRPIDAPHGIDVRWIARGPDRPPGAAALDATALLPVDGDHAAWVAGEQSLARDARRHWVSAGIPKDRIAFTGYWRSGRSS
ncbi:siderophore-interacting protein [Clavibacter sp. VKM Ac-2872]|uniref:siderophore-interacting protein n=1 Tax=Clavibacter sp. VKM Ac-2872 TaxID=2783812 RepID=UPI00188D5FF3|nr:siderophore-interacting protein [Clavibacter sp. VKM Ac-2872]MBF4624292.1 siderophore-interacting protein [Clavibacter sp. VKM Ac-2872]